MHLIVTAIILALILDQWIHCVSTLISAQQKSNLILN
jgi:hypothetical protein